MSEIERAIQLAMAHNEKDQAIAVQDESSASITSRRIQLFIFVSGLLLLVWASQARIDQVVSSRGEIQLEQDVERIQHLEGGMLEEIFISEGDHVYKGQAIARIKALDRHSELGVIDLEIAGLNMEIERLQALIDNRAPNFEPYADFAELRMSTQNKWQEEQAKNDSNDGLLLHGIRHKNQLIESMASRLVSSNDQLKLINEQLAIKTQLHKEDVASYIDVLNMRVQKMNMAREIQNLEEGILNERFELEKLNKQFEEAKITRRSEYLTQMSDNEKQLEIQYNHLPRAKDKVTRLTIYSPVDGYVDKIHFNYKSAVISPGESIADISPMRANYRAEAKIPRKDVGFIEVGQEVVIKMDTYSFTKYGTIAGKVSSISKSSYEEKDEMYYLAKIELDSNFLERKGSNHYIANSMEFTADIKTGQRTILDYALKPVMAAMEDSFDER